MMLSDVDMLEYLRIRNLALIEDAEMEFSDGINVLTGETGAGKSFILKAIGFLLGDRMNANMVRSGAQRSQVEAVFKMDDSEIILRRELIAESGRSRLYVNDKLHAQDGLKNLRPKLISMTSQHAQQELLLPSFQARLFDAIFPDKELLAKRDDILSMLHNNNTLLKNIKDKCKNISDQRDILEFQLESIEKVNPQPGEEESLDDARQKLRSEKDKRFFFQKALNLLYGENFPGLLEQLGDFEQLLIKIDNNKDEFTKERETLATLRGQLNNLASTWRNCPDSGDDINIDDIEERLFTLAQLKRKLKRSLPQIIKLRKEIIASLSFLDSCRIDIANLKKKENELTEKLVDIQNKILPIRETITREFISKLETSLIELGFSDHVHVIAEPVEQNIWGEVNDKKIRLLWAPNPGQAPQPLDKIASGGELSRFLLALTSLQDNADGITYIFDEVDSGVGGMTLNKLADKLDSLAHNRQILLITHWPQLAVRAKRHFMISKTVKNNNTYTLCSMLEGKERKKELSRMAGGGKQGAALANLLD